MTFRMIVVLGLLASGSFALSGCGASCASACDAIHECDPGEDDEFCVSDCEESRDDAAVVGCEPEFDDVVGCIQNLADTCDPEQSTSCNAELAALEDCARGG